MGAQPVIRGLFEAKATRPTPQTLTVQCVGCPTTATITRPSRRGGFVPFLPEGWTACGETPAGAIALWCTQCSLERRFEREA